MLSTQRQVEAALQRQTRLVAVLGRGAAEFGRELLKGVTALDQRLAGQSSKLSRIGSTVGLGLQRAAETSERGFARVASRVSLGFQRAAEAAEKANLRAAAASERAWGRVAAAAGRGLGRLSTSAGQVIGSAGTGLGSAISGLGTGGLGGIVRSAGSIAGVGIQGVSNLGGSVLGTIPGVGGLLKGGAQALGGIAGGVVQLGANLGGQLVESLLGAVKVGLVAGLGVTIAAAVKAAEGQQLRGAFAGITASLGEDASASLDKFKTATRGLVSELDLIQQFNQAVQLQAVKTSDEFAALADTAILLGKAVGRGPVESINDLTVGLGRQSPRILDNLGIIVDAEKAYADYAASVGKSADELSDMEKRTAFTTAAINRMKEAAGPLAGATGGVADKFTQFKVSISDLLEKAGQPLLGILGEILPQLTRMANAIGEFLSENKAKLAEQLSLALSGVAEAVKNAADYLERRGITGALNDAAKAGKNLWQQFKNEALAALELVSAEIDVFFSKLNQFSRSFVLFGGNERADEREARERESLYRNIGRNRAGLRRAGVDPDAPTYNGAIDVTPGVRPNGRVVNEEMAREIDNAVQRQVIAAGAALLPYDKSNRALIDQITPGGKKRNPLEFSLTEGAKKAQIDPDVVEKLFNVEALADLNVEQSRNIEEALKAEARRLEVERLITSLNEDRLAELKRANDYEKTVRERQQDALRDYNRYAEEEKRLRGEIVENIARAAIVIEETSAKVFDAFLRTQEEAARAQEQLVGQFRSAMQSAGSDPALPRNLRLGLQRGERLREREIRNRLRDQFGNLSAGEIAGSVDLQAQVEAGIVGTRLAVERPINRARDRVAETEAPKALSEEFAAIAEKAKADFEAAREELLEAQKAALKAIEDESAALVESLGSLEAFMATATEAYETSTAALEAVKKQADANTEKIASVERAVRSLK